MARPNLDKDLDGAAFQSCYFLKEELVRFCRREGLRTFGGKADLTKRIARYLETGERPADQPKIRASVDIENITEHDRIESGLICSEKHRAFFTAKIGRGF